MDEALPFTLGLVNPQEHPTDLLFLNYFLSIAMVTAIVYLFMVVIKLIKRKIFL